MGTEGAWESWGCRGAAGQRGGGQKPVCSGGRGGDRSDEYGSRHRRQRRRGRWCERKRGRWRRGARVGFWSRGSTRRRRLGALGGGGGGGGGGCSGFDGRKWVCFRNGRRERRLRGKRLGGRICRSRRLLSSHGGVCERRGGRLGVFALRGGRRSVVFNRTLLKKDGGNILLKPFQRRAAP